MLRETYCFVLLFFFFSLFFFVVFVAVAAAVVVTVEGEGKGRGRKGGNFDGQTCRLRCVERISTLTNKSRGYFV